VRAHLSHTHAKFAGSFAPYGPVLRVRRYRQGREAYEHAKREWKDQAEVYRLARRRMRAYRQELYRTRQQVRIEWR